MRLNLGSSIKKLEGYTNVDVNPNVNPDMILDLTKFPYPFADEIIEEIKMDAVLEHLDLDLMKFILEAKRILKPNGLLYIYVPNCFHWKARLRYLTGTFTPNSGFHYDHRWLFKPSFITKLLEHYGFAIHSTHNDWLDSDIKIKARKRL